VDRNSYLTDLAESESTDFGRVDFSAQSELQKVFSAVYGLEGQVANGGFAGYFASSDGDAASHAPLALRRIGAKAAASLAERALRVVSSDSLPHEQDAREQIIEGLAEDAHAELAELDEEFFAYPDDLTELLFAFVEAHPEAFGPIRQP
jgi:hypothetical protein